MGSCKSTINECHCSTIYSSTSAIPPPFGSKLYTTSPDQDPLHRSINRLERRLRVLQQRLEVRLVPRPGLGAGLEGIVLPAERVVAHGGGVAGTVALAAGLDPDERVDLARARAGGRACAEAGTLDVAPVTPLLAQALDAVAGGVDDGLVGHAGGREVRGEQLDVGLLVGRLVPLSVTGRELARCQVPGVPAGDVGREAAEGLGLAGGDVGVGEDFSTGL